ncbi:helix-turn-helix domain-containing protein [Nonomuraea sp. NPDC052265]|uniref:helix-turn-helix domain-containing protein n=1 Tax=Nonomuraea sp. NPDC052265 TaxID=3364374 RepID=UPI0037CC1F2B
MFQEISDLVRHPPYEEYKGELGRPPSLDAHGVEMARALYDMKGSDGKRRYTVQQIADRLGVSRATIYRHLDRSLR